MVNYNIFISGVTAVDKEFTKWFAGEKLEMPIFYSSLRVAVNLRDRESFKAFISILQFLTVTEDGFQTCGATGAMRWQ